MSNNVVSINLTTKFTFCIYLLQSELAAVNNTCFVSMLGPQLHDTGYGIGSLNLQWLQLSAIDR